VDATRSRNEYLDELNPAQREAATFGERRDGEALSAGPLLVVAGAGTGKTMTLAHRVAHLVVEGVDTRRILLLTFTRRAALEMTRRAGVLPWSGTFHSVGNRLLRRFAQNLGLDPGFSVLDRGDAADLMDVVRHELGLSRKSRRFPKKDTCLAIYSRCVNAQESLQDTLRHAYPWCVDWEDELRLLFRHYVERKQETQALDYDDLLLYWSHLVGEEDFAGEIGSKTGRQRHDRRR
jgi:DNA helicase-2/ATP-dependent DNA helicase PcrA